MPRALLFIIYFLCYNDLIMRIGKLTSEELNDNVLKLIKRRRNEVIVYPGAGEDCAVIRATEGLVFLSSDPITATSSNIGALAVHINCNDIAAGGAEPLGVMLTILLPPHLDAGAVKSIMESAEGACRALRIDILGGHTEFTAAVNSPVVSATAVGLGRKAVRSGTIEAGDAVVMTKSAAVEGTWIIAADHMPLLRAGYTEKLSLTVAEEEEALSLFKKISVLPESRIMLKHEVSGMHDITEGGAYGAIAEMCCGSPLGAEISAHKIPVLPVTDKICKILRLDPYRLLSGGSMVCACKRPKALVADLAAAGIEAAVIGKITAAPGVYAVGRRAGVKTEIKTEKDQIYKLNGKDV